MEYLGSQDWAISKLGKYRHLFWGISEEALARLNALPPSERLPWNPRVFADVLNSYVIDGARRAFEGKPNSRFVEENNTTYHLLNGCALWYKKLGSDGLPSNYPTETALDLMQGAFPFAPKSLLLVVGYQPDPATQRIDTVLIQRFRAEGKVQFYIELEKLVTKPKSNVIVMPEKIGDVASTRTRIRLKKGPEQQDLPAQGKE